MKTGVGERQELASGCCGSKGLTPLAPFHCRKCGQYLLDASPKTAVYCEKCRGWTGTTYPVGAADDTPSNPEGESKKAVTRGSVGLAAEITSSTDEVQRTFGFEEIRIK